MYGCMVFKYSFEYHCHWRQLTYRHNPHLPLFLFKFNNRLKTEDWGLTWQTRLDVALQWAGGWLGQERVGISPEQVRGEGQGKRQSVHAVGKLDGGNLHVYLGSGGLTAPLKWKLRLERELSWGIYLCKQKSMIAKTLDCKFIKSECIIGNRGEAIPVSYLLEEKYLNIFLRKKLSSSILSITH